tara:strand:+ start:382 stop:735 length:354 start_codon:yes stop_codon:yes gene_type:complete
MKNTNTNTTTTPRINTRNHHAEIINRDHARAWAVVADLEAILEANRGVECQFKDVHIDVDEGGIIRVTYDGDGFDYLSYQRSYPHGGDVRAQFEEVLDVADLRAEDVNSWSLAAYPD